MFVCFGVVVVVSLALCGLLDNQKLNETSNGNDDDDEGDIDDDDNDHEDDDDKKEKSLTKDILW